MQKASFANVTSGYTPACPNCGNPDTFDEGAGHFACPRCKDKFNASSSVPKEASAKPRHLLTAVPVAALEAIRQHGLLSGDELAKPENRHLLELARPGAEAEQWLADREQRMKDMPWNTSYQGTSTLFGEPDGEKLSDQHPTKRFKTTSVKIDLDALLADHPDTKLHGSELVPYIGDEAYDALDEKGKDDFVTQRHHDLSPEELNDLLSRAGDAKSFWQHYDDPEGKTYAANVPHAHVIVPGGRIDPKYLRFEDQEKQAAEKPVLYHGSSDGNITELEPRESRVLKGQKGVFATADRNLAMTFGVPWRDEDFEQGSVNGQSYMREMAPGNFEKFFQGRKGFLYHLRSEGFKPDPRLTKRELLHTEKVKPTKVEEIPDLWEALQRDANEVLWLRHGEVAPWEKSAAEKSLAERIADAEADVEPNPTDAQKKAGNYAKGYFHAHGMQFVIETAKGQTRSGTDKSGKAWSCKMHNSYGFIARGHHKGEKHIPEGADGDHLDIFLGPNPESEIVFVVDQYDGDKFDEHKAMVGFNSRADAKQAYLDNYAPGWKGCGDVTPLTMRQFRHWTADGNTKKPLAGAQLATFTKSASVQQMGPPTTGPAGIMFALQSLDLDTLHNQARDDINSKKVTRRPGAVKMLNVLEGLKRNNLQPHQLMITKVPVIPAIMRPFSAAGGTFIPGDANQLYRDLIAVRDVHQETQRELGDGALADANTALYDAVKAVYGYGDPVNPKSAAKGVSGFLRKLTGTNPKNSWVLRRMIGKPVDNVARGTATANPDLNINQIGLPREQAWKMFAPYIQRRLVMQGFSFKDALTSLRDRDDHAIKALNREITQRPVIYSRAPSWHKFNVVAGWASLHDGDSIMSNPFISTGMTLDHDGDQLNVHVPSTQDAVDEAVNKLMPDKMLFSIRDPDKVMPNLKHEMLLGLYNAQARPAKKSHKFSSQAEALEAIQRGDISLSDEIDFPDSKAAA